MSGNEPCILFMNHWAQELGGAEISLLDVVKESAARSARLHLLTSEYGKLTEAVSREGACVHVVKCSKSIAGVRRNSTLPHFLFRWKALLSFLLFIIKARKVVSEINPDLIYANVPKSHITMFLVYSLGYRGRCIVHMREIFDSRSFVYYLYKFFFLFNNATVIAVSQAVKNSLPSNIQPRVHVIYNGVSIGVSGISSDLYDSPPKFLYLGRMVPWKGCDLLIRAFALLHQSLGDSAGHLDFVGGTLYWDQSYLSCLDEMISKYELERYCSLLPPTENIESVFLSHNIFCTGSYREPFGRSAAEAQGFGLPVIGFATGGIPEIVLDGRTGLLVEYGDINSFVKAMSRLAVDPRLRMTMGMEGRKRAREFFNKEAQIPLISEFILDGIQTQTPDLIKDALKSYSE